MASSQTICFLATKNRKSARKNKSHVVHHTLPLDTIYVMNKGSNFKFFSDWQAKYPFDLRRPACHLIDAEEIVIILNG